MDKKKFLNIFSIILIVIFTNMLSIGVTKHLNSKKIDTEYKKLDINIDETYIDYYTVYDKDSLIEYKVYKIGSGYLGSGSDIMKEQIERSSKWSKTKFDEYVMQRFYEEFNRERYEIDRENLYFYAHNGIYAIGDVKNAKLYYYNSFFVPSPTLSSKVLEINTKGYVSREVYSVRSGRQYDGTDYYVFEFDEEKGEKIVKTLNNSSLWSKEKLDDDILDAFKYNEEVMNLENGYYHYKKVCRTIDSYKKEHFTEEEATGYEIGVYDPNRHIFYYYYFTY